ncbi:MAG: Fe-S cluster assembly protein SufD [Bacteroidetes bacterium]|nr:Fe-S cluster assembly protein SufD [Bacteroidota bacterium]|tara:strand:- start:1805 stop:3226 length:1422 start_codon:yes stop_codon:yes gene_type:complete
MIKLSENNYKPLELSLLSHYQDNKDNKYKLCHPKVKQAREDGISQFEDIRLPLTSNEKWHQTNIQHLYDMDFDIGDNKPEFNKRINEIFHCYVHGFDTNVFALLNGWYYNSNDKLLETLDDGIIVGSIIAAQEAYPELIDSYFNEIAKESQHGLGAVNAAVFTDGIFVYVPDNVESKKALQLIKMVNRDKNVMINSRNLIIVGKNSSLTFLHCDDSINQHSGFLVTNTEVFLDKNAKLDLYKLQNLNNQTTLVNSTSVHQESNSDLKVNVLTFNGGSIRNEINVDLQGEHAAADISGIYLIDNKQHVDNQVVIKHSVENCTSNEMFKGVLDDSASAVFNGHIFVARDAQRTKAFQKNANILMTPNATIDTMPFLEIYADDVVCSHGATVGQIDDNALFYLMQRGISESDAKLLLMYAFITEVTSKISINALRLSIDDMVKKRLRGDLSICDKCVLHCSTPDIPIEFEIDLSKI